MFFDIVSINWSVAVWVVERRVHRVRRLFIPGVVFVLFCEKVVCFSLKNHPFATEFIQARSV